MKRVLMIAAALSTLVVTMSSARAEDNSAYTLASCRRYVPQPPASLAPPTTVPPTTVPPGQANFEPNDSNVNPRSVSPPVMPASFSRTPAMRTPAVPNTPDLAAGRTYTVKTNYMGENAGDIVLYIGNTSHSCVIRSWAANEVGFSLPNMGVAVSGVVAELRITRPDGVVGLSRTVRVINPPDFVESEATPPRASTAQSGASPNFGGAAFLPTGGN